MPVLPKAFYLRPVLEAARELLGCVLVCDGVAARLVEVEAYRADDPASHSFRGDKGRASIMFREGGVAYVYRSYGVHLCMNVVTGPEGAGEAVLLRAAEPLTGVERMRERRGAVEDRRLCAGPGNLTQALGIEIGDYGASLAGPRLRIEPGEAVPEEDVTTTTRVGISVAKDKPWRFYLRSSRCVSRR
jgi:DNA-3-methyladenine glycosylase